MVQHAFFGLCAMMKSFNSSHKTSGPRRVWNIIEHSTAEALKDRLSVLQSKCLGRICSELHHILENFPIFTKDITTNSSAAERKWQKRNVLDCFDIGFQWPQRQSFHQRALMKIVERNWTRCSKNNIGWVRTVSETSPSDAWIIFGIYVLFRLLVVSQNRRTIILFIGYF